MGVELKRLGCSFVDVAASDDASTLTDCRFNQEQALVFGEIDVNHDTLRRRMSRSEIRCLAGRRLARNASVLRRTDRRPMGRAS